MAKRAIKKRVVKKEVPVHAIHMHPAPAKGLNVNKGDGIMAIMAAVLVTLIAVLNPIYAVVAADLMIIIFAIYKLFFRR
jgi:hypothetical protein